MKDTGDEEARIKIYFRLGGHWTRKNTLYSKEIIDVKRDYEIRLTYSV